MKYRIEKGSVQETLLIPLYGRKIAMDQCPDLFADRDCQDLLDKIDFDAPPMTGIKAKIGFKEEDGAVFFASDVFYYLKTEDVKKLFCCCIGSSVQANIRNRFKD